MAAIGVGLAVMLARQDHLDPDIQAKARVIVMITIMMAGVFVISATSRWWMSH